MVHYRRLKAPGAIYFFTVSLLNKKSKILTEHIHLLPESLQGVFSRHPVKMHAMVILPNHFHALWQLPEKDDNYSLRIRQIKSNFTRKLSSVSNRCKKNQRGEYNIWQRRFWEHMIRDDLDYERHFNDIHYNPVKHRLVNKLSEWPYSTFHHYVRKGFLSNDWCGGDDQDEFE